jgi:predicted DNA-binding transcriptional regulator AlpA
MHEIYKQHLTIPEAALLWSGLPFALLSVCEYVTPCVPRVLDHPEVEARARAIYDATAHYDLECQRAYRSEDGPELLDGRTVRRADLASWVKTTYGEEFGAAPQLAQAPVAEDDRLLDQAEVQELTKMSRATLHRLRKRGEFPEPTHTGPNRWLYSAIRDTYLNPATGGEDI